MSISIHAPTRGATGMCGRYEVEIAISIHAPTRGATQKLCDKLDSEVFQSTLPREERPYASNGYQRVCDFNPRSHERSDALSRFGEKY